MLASSRNSAEGTELYMTCLYKHTHIQQQLHVQCRDQLQHKSQLTGTSFCHSQSLGLVVSLKVHSE